MDRSALLKNKIWSKELEELVKIFAETFLEDWMEGQYYD